MTGLSVRSLIPQALLAGWVDPTTDDLAAIDAEWPVLAAELAVVDAECRFVTCPDVLARRALRRAVTARNRAVVAHPHPYPSTWSTP